MKTTPATAKNRDSELGRCPRVCTTALLGAPALFVAAPLGAALIGTVIDADAAAATTTFTVSNLNSDGAGSFVEAIAQSEISLGDDLIVFDPSLNGTISLLSQVSITQDLVIDGGGRITLDGSKTTRHIELASSNETLTLRGLTFINGMSTTSGGSVFASSDANLILENVTFSNNQVLGLYQTGGAISLGSRSNFSAVNSRFSDNTANSGSGGAIFFRSPSGSFSLTRTTISGNTASDSGGIEAEAAQVHVADSTISSNASVYPSPYTNFRVGGAEFRSSEVVISGLRMDENDNTALRIQQGPGQDATLTNVSISGAAVGLFLEGSTDSRVTVSNSSITNTRVLALHALTCLSDITIKSTTISGNSGTAVDAIGGYYECTANATLLEHSTITDNGVGIRSSFEIGSVELDHTIVAGNSVDLEIDVSADWSFIQAPNGHLLASTNTITDVDPLLNPLTHFGTLAVVTFDESSPVFNAGNPAFSSPPEFDEIGQPRVAFGRIDIGAWELQPATPIDPVVPAFTG